jgi:hypothetical protein
MNGICLARDALRRIISIAGHEACFNIQCFHEEQLHPIWAHQPCMGMLAEAIDHEIPAELLRLGRRVPLDMLKLQLVSYLRHKQPRYRADHARWIVESWSMSLCLSHFNHELPVTMLRPGNTLDSDKDSVLCSACVLGVAPSL